MKADLDSAVARLDDYIRGHQSEELESSYEEDLFARALTGEAPELTFRGELADTLRSMHARGTLDMWLTAREVQQLSTSALRVRHFDYDPARPTLPNLEGEFDLLVTRVPLDLQGVRQIDAEVLTPAGQRVKMMPDISFDPADGAVYACCEAALARAAAASQTITRVWVKDEGGRRLLVEFGTPLSQGM